MTLRKFISSTKRAWPDLTKMPLLELHVHAEGGTLTPSLIKALAQTNNMSIPDELSSLFDLENDVVDFARMPDAMFSQEQLTTVPEKQRLFLKFLAAYDKMTPFIKTAKDVQFVIYSYLKKCHEQGASYIELTCSPDHVKANRKTFEHVVQGAAAEAKLGGVEHTELSSYQGFVDALSAGIDQARTEFGIDARILMVLLRHNGADAAMKTLEEILSYRHPYVLGINMAGDEVNFPPENFEACYKKAKAYGLKLTAHVGEHAGHEFIIHAARVLKLNRIGHGITAIDSTDVMQYLKDNNIHLEICPTSNLLLKGLSIDKNPIKAFFDFGISVGINTDDPGCFGSRLKEEYDKVQKAHQFTDKQMLKIAQNTIKAVFAEAHVQDQLLAHLELYAACQVLRKALAPFKNTSLMKVFEVFEKEASPDNFHQLEEAFSKSTYLVAMTGVGAEFKSLKQSFFKYQNKRAICEKETKAALEKFKSEKKTSQEEQACEERRSVMPA